MGEGGWLTVPGAGGPWPRHMGHFTARSGGFKATRCNGRKNTCMASTRPFRWEVLCVRASAEAREKCCVDLSEVGDADAFSGTLLPPGAQISPRTGAGVELLPGQPALVSG